MAETIVLVDLIQHCIASELIKGIALGIIKGVALATLTTRVMLTRYRVGQNTELSCIEGCFEVAILQLLCQCELILQLSYLFRHLLLLDFILVSHLTYDNVLIFLTLFK